MKIVAVALLFLLALAVALLLRSQENLNSTPQDSTGPESIEGANTGLRQPSREPEDRDRYPLKTPGPTPPDDPQLRNILSRLSEHESARTEYCRTLSNDKRLLYTFVIERPTESEIAELHKIISSSTGLTEDHNGRIITWRERLLREYADWGDYSHKILTIIEPKDGRRGTYTLLGVPEGMLGFRGENSPFSEDGIIHYIIADAPLDFSRDWRFTHLFGTESE